MKYHVRKDQTLFEEFYVIIGLKQGGAFLVLLFNITLKRVIHSVKNTNLGTNIGATRVDVLVFADDLKLVRDSNKHTRRKVKSVSL